MKPIARFVFRCENGKANIILGTCFKNEDIFKDNNVWQIEEVLGELVLKNLGPGIIGSTSKDSIMLGCNWQQSINDLLDGCGNYLFLTREEFKSQVEKEEKEKENER
jgi:hypothetical protein